MVLALCVLTPMVFAIWIAVRGRSVGPSLFTDLRRRTLYPAVVVAVVPAIGVAFVPDTAVTGLWAALFTFTVIALPGVTGLILFGLPGTLWLARWRPPLLVALLTIFGVAFAGGWLLVALTFGANVRSGFIDLTGAPVVGGVIGLAVALAWIACNRRLLRDTLSAPRAPAERPIYPRSNDAGG